MSSSRLGPPIAAGRIAEIYAWGEGQVVKLFREGDGESATREWRKVQAIAATGIPTPAVGDLVEVGERRGIVFERVDGPPLRALLMRQPWRIASLARDFAALHRQIHQVQAPELPLVTARLRAAVVRGPLPEATKDAVLERLAMLPQGHRLCHGDFHPDNVIVTQGRLVVLDWADAAVGNPLADVARTRLLIGQGALASDTPPLTRTLIGMARRLLLALYHRHYFSHPGSSPSESEVAAWMVPIWAARLGEGIAEEEPRLMAQVADALR